MIVTRNNSNWLYDVWSLFHPEQIVPSRLVYGAFTIGFQRKWDLHHRLNKQEFIFSFERCCRQGVIGSEPLVVLWAGGSSQLVQRFIKLNSYNRKQIISQGTLSLGVCSIAMSVAATDSMERSMTGWPESALGGGLFPWNFISIRNPKPFTWDGEQSHLLGLSVGSSGTAQSNLSFRRLN